MKEIIDFVTFCVALALGVSVVLLIISGAIYLSLRMFS